MASRVLETLTFSQTQEEHQFRQCLNTDLAKSPTSPRSLLFYPSCSCETNLVSFPTAGEFQYQRDPGSGRLLWHPSVYSRHLGSPTRLERLSKLALREVLELSAACGIVQLTISSLELSRTSAYFAGARTPYRPFLKAVVILVAAQEWFDRRTCSG